MNDYHTYFNCPVCGAQAVRPSKHVCWEYWKEQYAVAVSAARELRFHMEPTFAYTDYVVEGKDVEKFDEIFTTKLQSDV